jgi:hypothetical protein
LLGFERIEISDSNNLKKIIKASLEIVMLKEISNVEI